MCLSSPENSLRFSLFKTEFALLDFEQHVHAISMCMHIHTHMPACHQSAVLSSQQGRACAAMQVLGRLVACWHVCVHAYAH